MNEEAHSSSVPSLHSSCRQSSVEAAYPDASRSVRDIAPRMANAEGATVTECVRCNLTFNRQQFDEHECEMIRKAAAHMAQTITQAVNSNMSPPAVGITVGGLKMEEIPHVQDNSGAVNNITPDMNQHNLGNASHVPGPSSSLAVGLPALSPTNDVYPNTVHNSGGSCISSVGSSLMSMQRTKPPLSQLAAMDNGLKTLPGIPGKELVLPDQHDLNAEKMQHHSIPAHDDISPIVTCAHSNVNAALTAQAQAALGANLPAYFGFNLAPYVHMLPQLQQQQQQQQPQQQQPQQQPQHQPTQQPVVSPQQPQQSHPGQHPSLQHPQQAHRGQDLGQNLDENCKFCQQQFQNIEDLRLHWRRAHKAQNVCDFCGSQHASYCALANHKALKHPTKTPYECHQCGQRFSRRCLLKRHLQKVKHQRSAWNKV